MPVTFTEFKANNLPPYQTPVLVQLKAESCPTFYRDADASTSQLAGKTFYGYTVCVLVFDIDGFGNRYPKHFTEIVINSDKRHPGVSGEIEFPRVAAWAVLP